MGYAELEIGLSGLDQAGRYQVELRFDSPRDQAERTPVRGTAAIDPDDLQELQDTPGNAYGLALTERLFADGEVRAKFGQCKAAAERADDSLRVKLFVDRGAPELHRLRWELLVDPETKQPLATSELILFSRFGSSSDWRPVRLRAKTELRALVAVASPTNLVQYGLAPVDVEGEVARAREHLQRIRVTVVGDDAPVTLDRLIDGLRDGVDILYLVCHGGVQAEKGALLYLQDEDGTVKPARGDELARRVGQLVERPRLVVLASCESAGSEQAGAQAAIAAGQLVPLAPALAEAGVHAVLAMQGKISMDTVKAAMPVFFAELLKDGQIDRALAVARGTVREQPDSWMLALFLRLKGGRIWYEPGFGDGERDFDKWKALVGAVHRGDLTPIVGPGLSDNVYGSLREVSRKLAAEDGFPLAEHLTSELQQVSQFLQFNQDIATARDSFKGALRDQILARHGSLPDADKLPLSRLMALVGRHNREVDPDDPYRLLAQLDAKLFVTANPNNLLEEALRDDAKEPDTFFFNWRDKAQAGEPAPERDAEPDSKHPLVFHIFGFFRDENSLVLTEDDYFEYLISLIQYKPRIPGVVGHQTTSTSLLFLGFQLTDWNFRVLYRLIMSQEGSSKLKERTHVAVQVDPEEDALINPRAARKYLEEYFGSSGPEKVHIFWGSAAEFLKELNTQLGTIEVAAPVVAIAEKDDW